MKKLTAVVTTILTFSLLSTSVMASDDDSRRDTISDLKRSIVSLEDRLTDQGIDFPESNVLESDSVFLSQERALKTRQYELKTLAN